MSKDRKILFQRPGEKKKNIVESTEASTGSASKNLESDKKILRSDLLRVFVIILIITASFTAIYISNSRFSWINETSERLVKLLIRNY